MTFWTAVRHWLPGTNRKKSSRKNDAPQRGVGDRRRGFALRLESLEDRTLFTVAASAQFLTAVYKGVLDRAPDPVGLALWQGELAGGASFASVAGKILASQEAGAKQVDVLYRGLLGRPLDAAGLNYWGGQLSAGVSTDRVLAGILASDESFARAGSNTQGFLQSVYHYLLGHDLTAEGLSYWGPQIAMGRSFVTTQILASAEAVQARLGQAYRQILQHGVDAAGANYWAPLLTKGSGAQSVLAGIMGSAEFFWNAQTPTFVEASRGAGFLLAAIVPPTVPRAGPQPEPRAQLYIPPATTSGSGGATVGTLGSAGTSPNTNSIPLAAAQWTPIGPAAIANGQIAGAGAVSGRVLGIAPDPSNANIVYIATAGGGVWKTTDAGQTWAPLTDGQSTLFMGSIAVAASNPNVIYAGTGEATNSGLSFYGMGVLRSTDAGGTWTLLDNNTRFKRKTISAVAISPTDPNTVYVAVAGGGVNGVAGNTGIWKSTDAGTSWTNTTTGIANITADSPFSDLVIDPTDARHLYAAIGNTFGETANGVYETTNAGTSWAASGNFSGGTTNGVIRLAIGRADPRVLYASAEKSSDNSLRFVVKTTNGGANWTDVSPTVNYMGQQGFYDQSISIDPTDGRTAYVGGAFNGANATGFTNQVLKTADGGSNWTDITVGANGSGVHPDHHAMAFDAGGKLLVGSDGGIWRLQNAAANNIAWTNLNAGLATLQFIGIGLHPTNADTVYGGLQDNGTNKFSGSLPWNQLVGGDGGFVRVDQTNPNTVYHTFFRVSGSTQFIERSDDGGATFTDISAGIRVRDRSQFYPPFVIDPTTSTRLVLGTDRVYVTTNKGAAWTAIGTPGQNGFSVANNAPSVTAVAIAKTDGRTIYVAVGGADIFVTTDNGANWAKRSIPNITDEINDLQVDPTNAQTVYAVRNKFGNGKVYKSTDGGRNWTDISGNLPDLPAYSLAIDTAQSALYLGNDNGVFSSSNNGQSWAKFGTGLPNVQAKELVLNTALNILAAGTHGRSAWEIFTVTPTPPPPPPPPPPPGPPLLPGGGNYSIDDESNQTSDTAAFVGVLSAGTGFVSNQFIGVTSVGLPDYDWFRWRAGAAGTFTVKLTQVTGNEELHLFTLNGRTLVERGASIAPGQTTRTLAWGLAVGEQIFVEAKGHQTAPGITSQGAYTLTITFG